MNQPADSKTPVSPQNTVSEAAQPAAEGNPVRLAILLGIMVVSLGTLGIGKFVFDPDVQAKSLALESEADKINSNALVKEKEPGKIDESEVRSKNIHLTREDVRKVLGRAPTKQVVVKNESGKDHFLKEYYCWWGPLPIPSCYITVIYSDPQGTRYKTHYPNGEPEEADLPPDEAKLKRQAEQANKDNANTPQMPVPDLSGGTPAPPGAPPEAGESAEKEGEPASEKKDDPEKKDDVPAKSEEVEKQDDSAAEAKESEKKEDDSK